MSLVPLLYRDWWDDEDLIRPSRLFDQQFGLGLRRDDLLNSLNWYAPSRLRNYTRPWRPSPALLQRDSTSTIQQDKEKFQVILDVQQFSPEEISVKVNGNSVVIEGKHEEKQDEHGFISRHFVRRYVFPQDHDVNAVSSQLSSDGVLTITAPKKSQEAGNNERVVPITPTGPIQQKASTEDSPK